MNVFRNISIKKKIMLIIAVTCLLFATLTFALNLLNEINNYRTTLLNDLETQAEITCSNCISLVNYNLEDEANDILQKLSPAQYIIAARLYKSEDTIFASYSRDELDLSQIPLIENKQNSRFYFGEKYLHVFYTYNYSDFEGDNTGVFELVSDLNQLTSRIQKHIAVSLVVLFIAIFLVFLLATSLIQIVCSPIIHLSDTAKKISSERNYSVRAQKYNDDELGNLIDVFNDMLKQIQLRESELQQARDELEIRVQQRTAELKSAQNQLIQSEKMASLGQLVAGVAHEVNNPINYIKSNITPLKGYLFGYKESYSLLDKAKEEISPELRHEWENIKEKYDLNFAEEDSTKLIKSFEEGSNRIVTIVRDLQQYSRVDRNYFSLMDLQESIDSTLNLLRTKMKDGILIHKQYGAIPQIKCSPGQVGQVFMNIISNAIDAVGDVGNIWISTSCDKEQIIVSIHDDGPGIPKEIQTKIFDPFFTTKPVGSGTGLGLSITHTVIEQHNGTITVESEEGEGTKFLISLPINM